MDILFDDWVLVLHEHVDWLFIAGNLGNIYYEQGQLDLAILSYRQAINCNSSYVEAYNNLVDFAFFYAGKSWFLVLIKYDIWCVLFSTGREML